MDFEFRSLWGPSSQVTFSARRALIAFQVLSATTAIAESLILSTKVTPGICLAAAASKSATLPPMTSQRASAGAAAGSLISEERAGAGLLDGDLLPVGFELFGENHGQRSSHPLAHLRAGDHYRDFAFRSDRQICVGRKCAFCLRLSARGQINADDQSRSRRRGGFEKRPPGKRRHFAPPAAR